MISEITRRKRAFCEVGSLPNGMTGVYQLGTTCQLSPTEAGVSLNIRYSGTKAIDLEIGCDFAIFDDMGNMKNARIQEFGRAEYTRNPIDNSEILMARYPRSVVFVPLGATLPDGTPHPAAGTGFCMGVVMGFPAERFRTMTNPFAGIRDEDIFYGVEIGQCKYDGKDFTVSDLKIGPVTSVLEGSIITNGGMGPGISDDSDGLFRPVTGENNPPDPYRSHGAGLLQWKYRDGKWVPVRYLPVIQEDDYYNTISGYSGNFVEPSVVRLKDGSLLFTAREVGDRPFDPGPLEAEKLQVFRSIDNGESWTKCFEVPHFHTLTPLTLGTTTGGSPFIVANPACNENSLGERPGSIVLRETMKLWPIKADFSGLEEPMFVRDCPNEFGKAPFGSYWRIDHPYSLPLRLKDGHWHSTLAFRLLEHNECDSDAPITPITGNYIEEIISDEPERPIWNFRQN